MASNNTAFGASIVPAAEHATHFPQPVSDSPALTPAVSQDTLQDDYSGRRVPPHSPFYEHPPASNELALPRTKNEKSNAEVYEKDIESAKDIPLSPASSNDENPFGPRVGVEHNKECTMWPSRQTLQQTRKQAKKQRRQTKGCTCCAPVRNQWSKMSAKNRTIAKVVLALFVIGVAVAIGVGISVAVKGTYYVADGKSQNVKHD